jgi:hypothetical protein
MHEGASVLGCIEIFLGNAEWSGCVLPTMKESEFLYEK